MQKPAGPKDKLRQARTSQAASAGCAIFAKADFLCDNKRHPFGEIIRPVGAAGAQVPYKHKVTGSNPVPATITTAGQAFFVWPFLFSGQSGAHRTKARLNSKLRRRLVPLFCGLKFGHASLPSIRRTHKKWTPACADARKPTHFSRRKPDMEQRRKRARLPFYEPETRRRPGTDPPYASQTRFSSRTPKRPPAQPTAFKLCKSLVTARKTPIGYAEALQGGRAVPYSPCTPFTAPSISRAWARDASVASPESMRAISAGRSSADSRRRQVWGIPSSPAILVTA